LTSDLCADCGAKITGGTTACRAVFHEFGLRAIDRTIDRASHWMLVDAYALQHPEPYCHSAKSLAAHLTGLCCALEHDRDQKLRATLQRWLNGTPALEKPEVPVARGRLTIADVHRVADSPDEKRVLQEWARSVWDAWSDHHETARRWIRTARERNGPGR